MNSIIGGKARGLELLLRTKDEDYEVPEFDVLDTDFTGSLERYANEDGIVPYMEFSKLPSEVRDSISALSEKYDGQKIVVRSSSLHEDGIHSFAGIYESIVLDTSSKEDITRALIDVVNSKNSQRAISYRKEHGIPDDKMAVIIQEFIEPEWAGVIYTSNPTSPRNLTIEFTEGRNKVVDGQEQPHIIDYDKERGEIVFKSEDFPEKSFDIKELARMCNSLEDKIGPSDIEFAIKDGKIYLVQARKITDLQEPEYIEVPDISSENFIASTRISRGSGKVTLPVVVVEDYVETKRKLDGYVGRDDIIDSVIAYFRKVMQLDKQFPDGYILVTPKFRESNMNSEGIFIDQKVLGEFPKVITMDSLTPNKKGIITTGFASISSHAMTIAREQGVHYAGFNFSDAFEGITTGDMLSMYFRESEAFLFKEEQQEFRRISERYPDVTYTVENGHYGTPRLTTSIHIGSHIPYGQDFLLFLREHTGEKWTLESRDGIMDHMLTNQKGETIYMHMSHYHGVSHDIGFAPAEVAKAMGFKPVPDNKLKLLVEAYVVDLTGNKKPSPKHK